MKLCSDREVSTYPFWDNFGSTIFTFILYLTNWIFFHPLVECQASKVSTTSCYWLDLMYLSSETQESLEFSIELSKWSLGSHYRSDRYSTPVWPMSGSRMQLWLTLVPYLCALANGNVYLQWWTSCSTKEPLRASQGIKDSTRGIFQMMLLILQMHKIGRWIMSSRLRTST